jgi:DNA-binding MarR family transcriptional regulator
MMAAADDRLDAALSAVVEHMRTVWFERLRAHELSPPQAHTLKLLSEPQPMRWLADAQGCDASNITGIADRLEERGLIERQADPNDRRVKILAVTRTGAKLRDQIFAGGVTTELPGLESLNAQERRQLAALLERLVKPIES